MASERETLETGRSWKYYLRQRLAVTGETWELWQGFREIAMVRYKCGADVLRFDGEWLGWRWFSPNWLEVTIPAQIELAGRQLEDHEVAAFSARMHYALVSMKLLNAVVHLKPCPPLSESEREAVLREFQEWMPRRDWKVVVDRDAERLKIRPNLRRRFRLRKTDGHEIVDQGAWVAKAFHALLYNGVDYTVLFVGERAGVTSTWLAEVEW
ncbi:MAG: hypothetical protein U0Q16_30800 [Bryobacteraceae bacterium]